MAFRISFMLQLLATLTGLVTSQDSRYTVTLPPGVSMWDICMDLDSRSLENKVCYSNGEEYLRLHPRTMKSQCTSLTMIHDCLVRVALSCPDLYRKYQQEMVAYSPFIEAMCGNDAGLISLDAFTTKFWDNLQENWSDILKEEEAKNNPITSTTTASTVSTTPTSHTTTTSAGRPKSIEDESKHTTTEGKTNEEAVTENPSHRSRDVEDIVTLSTEMSKTTTTPSVEESSDGGVRHEGEMKPTPTEEIPMNYPDIMAKEAPSENIRISDPNHPSNVNRPTDQQSDVADIPRKTILSEILSSSTQTPHYR